MSPSLFCLPSVYLFFYGWMVDEHLFIVSSPFSPPCFIKCSWAITCVVTCPWWMYVIAFVNSLYDVLQPPAIIDTYYYTSQTLSFGNPKHVAYSTVIALQHSPGVPSQGQVHVCTSKWISISAGLTSAYRSQGYVCASLGGGMCLLGKGLQSSCHK